MITISNDFISAAIAEKGAELQSLQSSGLEYVWQANPEFWPKHSPVLFPIVGELKNGAYIFEGREYKMSRHGFAREKVFTVIASSVNAVTLRLQSDETTFAVYPFKFVLDITYKIDGDTLSCNFLVKNVDLGTMYFSIGGHPAFNVPLEKGLQYSHYTLEFKEDDLLEKSPLENGLIANTTQKIELTKHLLPLHPALFYQDAIVLKSLKSKHVTLSSDKGKHGLTLSFEGFPYFGIWASKDAPFVCLEPWCGIADNVDHDQVLGNKEGMNKITPGQSWERTWKLQVF